MNCEEKIGIIIKLYPRRTTHGFRTTACLVGRKADAKLGKSFLSTDHIYTHILRIVNVARPNSAACVFACACVPQLRWMAFCMQHTKH